MSRCHPWRLGATLSALSRCGAATFTLGNRTPFFFASEMWPSDFDVDIVLARVGIEVNVVAQPPPVAPEFVFEARTPPGDEAPWQPIALW